MSDELIKQKLMQELDKTLADYEWHRQTNKFLYYTPYPKQLEFHALNTRERLLIAANQVGKSVAAGMEMAYHATGIYPSWWPEKAKRYTKPTVGWIAGVSLEGLRDGAQRIMLGNVGQEGTGAIPKNRILQVARKQNNAIDFIRVRYGPLDGKLETFISFKSYDQGREKFQAASVDWIWFDEEPPEDIYYEGITRTNATKGTIFMTFTPLKGVTQVVRRFLYEPSPDRGVVQMTIDDALHINEEDRKRIIASYAPHELEARTKGVPVLGSGLVYPIEESLIAISPIPIPRYWPRLGAMDFGWDHPFAAVELAYDKEMDCVYVIRTFKIKNRTPIDHAAVLKLWGKLRWVWPRDGMQHDKGNGEQLKEQYAKYGLNMYPSPACFKDNSYNVEPGLFEILQRMQTGRFKVFNTCTDWLEEFRLYYRENGKIIKTNDDLMDATRYGVMMLRKAQIIDEDFKWQGKPPPQFAIGTGECTLH